MVAGVSRAVAENIGSGRRQIDPGALIENKVAIEVALRTDYCQVSLIDVIDIAAADHHERAVADQITVKTTAGRHV